MSTRWTGMRMVRAHDACAWFMRMTPYELCAQALSGIPSATKRFA